MIIKENKIYIEDKNKFIVLDLEEVIGYEVNIEVPNKLGLIIGIWLIYSYVNSIWSSFNNFIYNFQITYITLLVYFLLVFILYNIKVELIIKTKERDIKINIKSLEEVELLKNELKNYKSQTNIF